MRFLLIGPLPYIDRKSSFGGATVLFDEMITFLKNEGTSNFVVIPSNRFNSRVFSFLYLISKSIFTIRNTDVIFLNVNSFGVKLLWPIYSVLAKWANKKLILRVFGSHFNDDMRAKYFSNTLQRLLPKVNLLLLETKNLVSEFKVSNSNTIWLPNVRKSKIDIAPKSVIEKKKFKRKFIYLGHITEKKGIRELVEAFKNVPNDYELSIYGEILDGSLSYLNDSNYYKGVIDPENVFTVLRDHDVLILPTYYHGEGYPGVIIEAYREGLPVISTNWKSIPEIVENGKAGILISPKNSDELLNAILYFNEDNYSRFAQNALEAFHDFDSSIVHGKLFKEIIPETLKID